MIHPNYHLEHDIPHALLVIRLSGTWDMAVTRAFTADLMAVIAAAVGQGADPDGFVALLDMRRKNILPQDVAATLGEVRRIGARLRRTALMVSGTLHKLQARRLVPARSMRFFEDEEEARAWLLSAHDPDEVADAPA